jgi:hypothetical protein
MRPTARLYARAINGATPAADKRWRIGRTITSVSGIMHLESFVPKGFILLLIFADPH